MPQRRVTAELVGRWRQDLIKPVPQRWWVAELKGSIVGFVGIGPSRDPLDPTLGELDTIAVDPSYWRTGIGRILMSVALQHLTADDYHEAVLWTLAGYKRGQNFYEAMGRSLDGGARGLGRRYPLKRNLPLRQPITVVIAT
jgi:N-acetylglutamate synthase-like GNAT family acetyltransferase